MGAGRQSERTGRVLEARTVSRRRWRADGRIFSCDGEAKTIPASQSNGDPVKAKNTSPRTRPSMPQLGFPHQVVLGVDHEAASCCDRPSLGDLVTHVARPSTVSRIAGSLASMSSCDGDFGRPCGPVGGRMNGAGCHAGRAPVPSGGLVRRRIGEPSGVTGSTSLACPGRRTVLAVWDRWPRPRGSLAQTPVCGPVGGLRRRGTNTATPTANT